MARTITLTNVVVKTFVVDMVNKKVVVGFDVVDATGKKWFYEEATFWVTMPNPPLHFDANGAVTELPQPDNYFQLPASYATQLASIVGDALTAIKAKYLV
jgi:hypothetical protein